MSLEKTLKDTITSNFLRFQYTLSNGFRVDSLIILPNNQGAITIDSKFPLETYKMMLIDNAESVIKQFKADMKKHITDVSKNISIILKLLIMPFYIFHQNLSLSILVGIFQS